MLSRRSFLKQVSGIVAAVEVFPRSLWAEDSPVHVPGKEGMIVRSARFLDLEMPMEALKTWITPVPHFFVRNHMHEPSTLDPSTWVLTISGAVSSTPSNVLEMAGPFSSHTCPACSGNAAQLGPHASPGRECAICCSVPA